MNTASQKLIRLVDFLQADPNNAVLLLDCATTARASNDNRALGFCERALELEPNNQKALFLAGELHLDQQNYQGASHYFAQLLNQTESSGTIRYNLALSLMLQSRHEEAENAIAPLLETDKNWPAAWSLYGRIKFFLADLVTAREFLERCIDAEPQNSEALGLLSLLCLDTNDTAHARSYAQRALNEAPNNYEALLTQATLSLTNETINEAREFFAQLLNISPVTGRALFGQGLLEMRGGNYAEAESYLQRCISLIPKHADVHNALAWSLLVQMKTSEAIEAFRIALALDETNAEHRASLACALIFNGQLDEARLELDLAKKQGGLPAEWAEWLLLLSEQPTISGALDMRKLLSEALGPNGATLQTFMHQLLKEGKLPPLVGS